MIVELSSDMPDTITIERKRYEELKMAETKLIAINLAFDIGGIKRSEIRQLLKEVETFNLRPHDRADETLIGAYVEMYINKLRKEKTNG